MQALRYTIPLQRRKILKKSLGITIKLLLISGVIGAAVFGMVWVDQGAKTKLIDQDHGMLLVLSALFVLLIVFSKMIYEYLYYLTYFYDMDEKNVIIRKGVVVKREITLPFSKITDVYVDQDIYDVMLGLWDLHISTPTVESGLFAHIDGLSRKGSAQMRQMILDKING